MLEHIPPYWPESISLAQLLNITSLVPRLKLICTTLSVSKYLFGSFMLAVEVVLSAGSAWQFSSVKEQVKWSWEPATPNHSFYIIYLAPPPPLMPDAAVACVWYVVNGYTCMW